MQVSFSEPSPAESQVGKLVSEGYTVYVSRFLQKIKKGEGMIEFNPIYRMDRVVNRPIVDGGFYATKDEGEIALIDSFRDLGLRRYAPAEASKKK